MRNTLLISLILSSSAINAQNLPLNVDWSAFLPYGSENGWPLSRVCIDGPNTAWLLEDDLMMELTTSDGVVCRYDANGLPLDAYPFASFGCGSLDHPIAFFVRNDSVWILMYHQLIGGDQPISCCLRTPGGEYQPSSGSPFTIQQTATDIYIEGTDCTISASSDSTFTEAHQRLTRVDVSGNVIWEVMFPTDQFNGFSAVEGVVGGDLLVADFPDLHWFSPSNGDLVATISAYTGAPTLKGDVKIWNNEIYWAATEGATIHYGRTAFDGTLVWSDSIASSDVTEIAVDDQGRMWLIGTFAGQGVLSVIGADGVLIDTWYYGAALSDVDFGNSRITITGAMSSTSPDSFMVTGIPNL